MMSDFMFGFVIGILTFIIAVGIVGAAFVSYVFRPLTLPIDAHKFEPWKDPRK